ncbi:hypothetical protein V492_02463 [Pseudogymnoascus sp. VKM F-4246]|nr:hypothetical protein V492_02463 [Pseudogymnoascus sp. VKM F-4246]
MRPIALSRIQSNLIFRDIAPPSQQGQALNSGLADELVTMAKGREITSSSMLGAQGWVEKFCAVFIVADVNCGCIMASSNTTIRRLQQTTHHITSDVVEPTTLSLVHGGAEPALVDLTLGELLDEQCALRGDKTCLVVPWTGARWSYSELQHRSRSLAKAMLALGVRGGDRVGILAGNCEDTYTATEAQYALDHSGCKLLFAQEAYGNYNNTQLLAEITPNLSNRNNLGSLKSLVMIKGLLNGFPTYDELIDAGALIPNEVLKAASMAVSPHDICNLQYTSGSTGQPKAAMLTHHNMINNAHSIGHRMSFTPADILCCPPPLFHCFGLVLGLLVCITHGSTIVLPSPSFSAPAVLSAISSENCTALHGVPAMFEELLSIPRPPTWSCPNLRTGIVAGAPVPVPLMERMVEELNMREFTSSYGLTEASPTCFNAHAGDSIHRKLTSVGRVLPHLRSKIVDRNGNIVPVGTRGELCMAGYSLQKGYWNNPDKTREVMIRDEQGVVWLHTGDEAVFDEEGYCTITGRFKDIIIRGGENIYPLEVESRLVAHPTGLILRAAVVGIPHPKYGEVVGAFLLPSAPFPSQDARPTDDELRAWVREVLGRHKAPAHIFWFGDAETGMREVPQTGSGKVKKHVLRDVAGRIVGGR